MPTFMFWNLNHKRAETIVAEACRDHNVDILLLAEADIEGSALLKQLNSRGEFRFIEYSTQVHSAIRLFHRLPRKSIRPVFDDGRISIRRITPPIGCEILLVACHLISKLYSEAEDQSYSARELQRRIVEAETKAKHKNCIVIGDLNMNPFEIGVAAADGLHGVMDKRVAQRATRVVQGTQRELFYNPMWSRMGDESEGPSGTYYYGSRGNLAYFWHTLDQVLLRPNLLPYYESANLKVLSQIGTTKLTSLDGIPIISDHLPLVIRLDTERAPS